MPRGSILVVDDELEIREGLGALLTSENFEVTLAGTGEEGLQKLEERPYDLVLLDVSLPDLNGLDLQKQLAGERLDMPIIFITGYGDIPMTVRAMKAGAVEFLTKPLAEEALLGAIRHAIDHSTAKLRDEAELQALRGCYASLSRRERQVMALVVCGRLNKQVGGELGISEITVKAQIGRAHV